MRRTPPAAPGFLDRSLLPRLVARLDLAGPGFAMATTPRMFLRLATSG